jgi:hypothetical protein
MRNVIHTFTRRDGFTVVEVLVAAVVLMVGVLGALALIDRANATTVTTRSREAATNLARELVEGARGVPYGRLTPAALDGEIQALPRLGDASPQPGWTIRRRGFTYTVTTQVCPFDDAADGGGDHTGGGFCSDSAATTDPADPRPEDYRRVRVEVRWTHNGVEREVHQTELINNPGAASPSVRTLELVDGATLTNEQVTSTLAPHTLDFALTTSTQPATLHWLLDGRSQGPITDGSDLAWSFEWEIGEADADGSVVDGTYVVSAEAFDQYGVAGNSRSLTVVLNRTYADAVTGLVGGRTGDPSVPDDQVVDLEWLPTPERDIVGYTVERLNSATNTWEVISQRANVTSFIDFDPPVEDGLRYRVRAWDIDENGDPRPNPSDDPSNELVVPLLNPAPPAPDNVCGTTLGDGTVQLEWDRPDDAADPIAFYRIYRDGSSFDDRYATWDSGDAHVIFVDGNPGSSAHGYWVTAVDAGYAESDPVEAEPCP